MPSRHAASIPARIAAVIESPSTPLTTISSTELTPSASAHSVTARNVGQDASLPEAIIVFPRRRHGQDADAWTGIGGFVGPELALDARFAFAADDRGGKTGHLERRFSRPSRARSGHDDARDTHRKRLGERVLDHHATNVHR